VGSVAPVFCGPNTPFFCESQQGGSPSSQHQDWLDWKPVSHIHKNICQLIIRIFKDGRLSRYLWDTNTFVASGYKTFIFSPSGQKCPTFKSPFLKVLNVARSINIDYHSSIKCQDCFYHTQYIPAGFQITVNVSNP